MTLRRVFFWLHLTAGCLAGAIVMIMSVTGVLLMYEKQMILRADLGSYRATPGDRLPMENLIAKMRDVRGSMPSTVTVRSDPAAPVMFTFGRDQNFFVDPATGAVLGEGSKKIHGFFQTVTAWHRWLGAQPERRATARAFTGAANLAFLFLVASGLYLWWHSQTFWFRGGLKGKARDFNWHNVIGFWCAAALLPIVLGGVIISYPWASSLIYRPAAGGPPAAGAPATNLPLEGMDRAWQRAQRQVPGWRTISLRLPGAGNTPLAFTIDRGAAGQPQKRAILYLDATTREVVRWEPFSSYGAGRQWRTWLRFVHTGEYYGLAGQTIAGIASAGAAMLVWTGLALAWRRYRAWRMRRCESLLRQSVS